MNWKTVYPADRDGRLAGRVNGGPERHIDKPMNGEDDRERFPAHHGELDENGLTAA